MKNWIAIGLMVYSTGVFAQRKIEKTIAVPSNHSISMDFDFPELIQVHTWDKKEVLIRGEVSINHGENDDAFELSTSTENGKVVIASLLKDQDNIPTRIVIKKGDQEFFFKTSDYNHPDIQKFLAENSGQYQYMSQGILRSIRLEVFVPHGVTTRIESKFGIVEITDFNAPLVVVAKHGSIDAQINSAKVGDLTARTRHGEILTNLDLKFDVTPSMDRNRNDGTEIKTKLGNGFAYNFEATHGKVYLRKTP